MSKLPSGVFVRAHEARVNITFDGQNGDLAEPVAYGTSDAELLARLGLALRRGRVPGISRSPGADLSEFVVDRFSASEARPYHLIQVRPATPFG